VPIWHPWRPARGSTEGKSTSDIWDHNPLAGDTSDVVLETQVLVWRRLETQFLPYDAHKRRLCCHPLSHIGALYPDG